MRETPVAKQFLLNLSRSHPHVRIFRNNTGLAWQGKKLRLPVGAPRGSLLLGNPRPVKFGLHVGSADYIGWNPVTITPDMVGQTIAQFVSVETKRLKGGRINTEQENWARQVNLAGGVGIFVNDPEKYVL